MSQKTSHYSRRRLATAIGVLGALALSACSPLNLRTTLTRAGAQGSDRTGQAVAMSNDGTTMVVGSPYVTVRGTAEAGVVTVYGRDAAALEWTKVTEIAAKTPYEEGHFGMSVALSGDGNTMVVGAPQQNAKGAVTIFTRVDGEWNEGTNLLIPLAVTGDNAGYSVAIANNGKVIAVGIPYQDVAKSGTTYRNAGRVWVYEDSAGVWVLRTIAAPSILQADENFGAAVALSGDGSDLVIGMPGYDMYSETKKAVQDASGRSELFRRSGNLWSFSAHLSDASTIVASAAVGTSVGFSSDGSTIAVGAPGYDSNVSDVGAVITYKKVNNGWERTSTLTSDAYPSSGAGRSVAISSNGEYIAVGAAGYNAGDGAVLLMSRTATGYEASRAYSDSSDAGNGIELGRSVAISSDAMVVAAGAPSTANFAGAVRMFDRFTKPDEPTAVTATAASASALVAWTAPANNGGLAPTYTVTSNPEGQSCVTSATSCVVTGLTNGVAYTFRVSASNAAGRSQGSLPSAAIMPLATAASIGTAPGAPLEVAVVPGWKRATVSWKAPIVDGGQPVHTYVVTAAPGGQTCTTFGATACTIIGLKAKKQYSFSVVAMNAVGTSAAALTEKYALQPKVSLNGGPTAARLAGWQGIASGIGEITSMKLIGKAAKQNCRITGGKLVAKVPQADCKVRVTSKYVKTLNRTVVIHTVRR